MHLSLTKKFERDRSSIVTLDNIVRGILPDKILLTLFFIPFDGVISEQQAVELLDMIKHQAQQQLLKYISDSEHSSRQCREYLTRKLYQKATIDHLVTDFIARKYIDDTRYLHLLISSLIERKKSKRAIIAKLKETRLPSELWQEMVSELFIETDNLENLKEQVLKLRIHYAELPKSKQKEKIFASLFRKGFDLEDVHSAWIATGEQ